MAINRTTNVIYNAFGPYALYSELTDSIKNGCVYFCTDDETSDYHGLIIFNDIAYGKLTDKQLKAVSGVSITSTSSGVTVKVSLADGSFKTSTQPYDAIPMENSPDLVSSGGIYTYLYGSYKTKLLNNTALTGIATTATANGSTPTQITNVSYVTSAIQSALTASGAMRPKGTVGSGGTVAELPIDNVAIGDTYIVYAVGTYNGQESKVGDMFIAQNATGASGGIVSWWYVPSGNEQETFLNVAATLADINITTSAKSGTIQLGDVVTRMVCNDWGASIGNGESYVPTWDALKAAINSIDVTGDLESLKQSLTEDMKNRVYTVSKGATEDPITVTIGVDDSGNKTVLLQTALVEGTTATTAKTYGASSAVTPAFGETFSTPYVEVDKYGRVIKGGTRNVTIPVTTATTEAAGLMSATDKSNLNALVESGVWYKVTSD